MGESIKRQTIKGVFWSGLEKISTYLVTFIINVIMARLLTPADYGVVGIIAVFVSFSQLFIDGGFTTALIAKSDRDETDYSTVFVFNFVSSIILYILLFLGAPLIEDFYGILQLGEIIRAYCLTLILSSFSAVQITQLTVRVDFKSISKINIPAGVFSGCFGIFLAYLGWGVWAIVGQQLLFSVLRVVLAIYFSKWYPVFSFSFQRFKRLFAFSSNLVLASLIDKIYTNSYPLFIGKFFEPATLGNYTRGVQFGSLPSNIMGDIFNRVTFPLMSNIQDDNLSLVKLYRKYIKLSSFIIFPIMMMVVIASEPIVRLLLTEKWLGCVRFMQIISMAFMLAHIGVINRNLLYVKKHSDWALRLEIFKKVIAILIFLVSTIWGIWGVVIGQWVYDMIAPSLNAYYTKRLIGLSLWQQIHDYIGLWFISVSSAIIPLWFVSIIDNVIIQLFVPSLCYIVIYVLLNVIFKTEPLGYAILGIQQIIVKWKEKK